VKETKRLVRGIKDISTFFVSHHPAVQAMKTSELKVPALRVAPISVVDMTSQVQCLMMLPHVSQIRWLNHSLFMREIKQIFQHINLLTISTHSGFNHDLPEQVRQLVLPPIQMHDVLHPEPRSAGEHTLHHLAPAERFCFFLEPKTVLEKHQGLLQLLDHIILTVSADTTDSLLEAYKSLSFCLRRNPDLRCSLLIEGTINEAMISLVYERFAKITCEFLGANIDFLGWVGPDQVCMNHELLVRNDSRANLIREPMKSQLMQLMSDEMFLETA